MDHLLNKAFAQRHGLRFVRLALVPMAHNQGWGRKIEKALTQTMARDNSVYLFDYFIFMKVMNILPPADKADYEARRGAIARRLCADSGLSEKILLQGMDGMFLTLWPVL